MAGEWADTTLGSVLTLQRGFDLPETEREPGSYPVIASTGPVGRHTAAMVQGPGVVIGRSGTLGGGQFIRSDFWPLNTTLWIKDFKGNDRRFCYYLLKSLDLAQFNAGSGVPTLNRNHIHPLPVRVPKDPSEQRAIAHILGTLDDKIELNQKMNETLEAMARAIFKSWFVDFDPVRAKAKGRRPIGMDAATADHSPDRFQDSELGEIPKGWEVRSLDKIADYLNGLALQKFPPDGDNSLPVIKIAQLRADHTENADRAGTNLPQQYIIDDGDVLFSWSGSLEVEIWCGGQGALNQHLFKVTSNQFPKWFYYLWTRHHLSNFQDTAADKATTMGHIQRRHLSEAKTLVPPSKLLEIMNRYFAPFIDKFVANRIESHTLAAIRDALLPKLLSGEIRVHAMNNFVSSS